MIHSLVDLQLFSPKANGCKTNWREILLLKISIFKYIALLLLYRLQGVTFISGFSKTVINKTTDDSPDIAPSANVTPGADPGMNPGMDLLNKW